MIAMNYQQVRSGNVQLQQKMDGCIDKVVELF
jgi:hypothetical protein